MKWCKGVTVLLAKEPLQEKIRCHWLEKIHHFLSIISNITNYFTITKISQKPFCVNKNELKEKKVAIIKNGLLYC
jgi:hypothetical protein